MELADFLHTWLQSWADIQKLGVDRAVAWGFWGTIVFTVVEAVGLISQTRTLWRSPEKKGESVDNDWMLLSTAAFAAFIPYGYMASSFASFLNGCALAPLYLPIVIGLWKFKGFTKADWALTEVIGCALVFDLLFPFEVVRAVIFFVFAWGSLICCARVPREMNKHQSTGVVDLVMLLCFIGSSTFWVGYAVAMQYWQLLMIPVPTLAVLIWTLVIWCRWWLIGLEKDLAAIDQARREREEAES